MYQSFQKNNSLINVYSDFDRFYVSVDTKMCQKYVLRYSTFKKQLIYINKWFGGPGFMLQGLKLKEAYFILIAMKLKIKHSKSSFLLWSTLEWLKIMTFMPVPGTIYLS